jgi:hypothetical protein
MRGFAAIVLSLSLAAVPLLANEANDAGTEESRATAAADKPKEATKSENAVIESEMEDLRSLVEEQKQELEAQRAALKAQQLKMETLEEKLRTTTAEPVSSPVAASTATSAATPSGATTRTVAVPANPSPAQAQDIGKRLENVENRLKSFGPFSFSGDFRLRDEPFFGGPANQSQVRNRERIRLRFNVNAKLNDDISGGFSVASGDMNDPISTNQTINQFFTRKPFSIDRAFINYTPHQFKPLTLTGGKFGYPWYRTELTWDNDLNPEGVAQKLEWKSEKWTVLRQFAFVGFELPFGETAGVNFNYPDANNRSIHQSVVYGGQIQTAWQLTGWLKFTADTAFYNFHNPDPIAFAIATANASSPANGLLKLGGQSFQNSYQTVSVTTPVCLPPECATTTNVNSSIINAKLNSKFALLDTIAQFDIKTPSAAWPVRLLADYVQNTRACANVGTPIFVPSVAAGTTTTTTTVNGACDPRQRRGYWLEARLGNTRKGDWQFAYTRMFIEREAVMSAFNFSDLRQNSNVSQHRVEIFYQVLNNVQLAFTGLFGRPIDFGSTPTPERLLKRLQFDVVYRF